MGLLDYIIQSGQATKRNIRSLLDDPSGYTNALLNRGVENTQAHLNKLTGKPYNQNNDQAYQDAMNEVAFNGMFIGPSAKTWNKVMNEHALKLEKAGSNPREIWKETGNWKGPDGKWRQEIPDNEAKIKGLTYQGREGIEGHGELTNFLNHNDMYAAYPDTGKIQSSLSQSAKAQEFGSYSNDGPAYSEFFPQLQVNAKNVKSPLLHELQHAIQQREGWARGGSPEEIARLGKQAQDEYDLLWKTMQSNPKNRDKIIPELDALRSRYRELSNPNDAYRRLAGEAEARATQARMNMDMAQRLNTFPEDSYDVPVNQLIIRGLLGE